MAEKQKENLISRPPVVVVMGHVDHGKSSILEAIKDLKITAKESGGITQHIGAYEVEHNGKSITFIDTPGHEAFSAMRSRGANVADIAILVVAGEEGIKPQTKEAIEHIKKSGIPMIVAINKIDKPTADPEKIKRELISFDVVVEAMGGKIPSINVSAKTKQGINELLEMILLIWEIEGIKADIALPAKGVIIESYMDSFKGPVATVILSQGKLERGDLVGTPSAFGKVRNVENFQKKNIDAGLPATPIILLGFENVPGVGEEVMKYNSEEEYKAEAKKPAVKMVLTNPVVGPDQKVLNLIIKADFFGSLEAVMEVLKDLPQDRVVIKILKADVGDINDADVKLANTSDGKIIGFRVKANPAAKNLAMKEKITVISFDIIYELAQAVRNLLEKSIKPEIVRNDLGQVKILAVFKSDKSRQIIGGKVIDGIIKRGAFADIVRNEEKIGNGKIVGLQQDKKETPEVGKRSECGMLFESAVKVDEGDILKAYVEERKRIELV